MNKKKRVEHQFRIVFVSLLEALITFIIVSGVFLERMFEKPIIISLFIVSIIILIALLTWHHKDIYENADIELDLDIQFETIKNNIILFLITIFPFYLFLTIFRFQSIWIQFGLSLFITMIIFGLHSLISESFISIFENVKTKFSISGPIKWVILFAIALFSILSILLFNLPDEQLGMHLNLSSQQNYLEYRGIPAVLESNQKLEQKETIEVIEESYFNHAYDYQIIDNLIYLYSASNVLLVYDMISGEKVFTYTFSNVEEEQIHALHAQSDAQNHFTVYGDTLLISTYDGVYEAVGITLNKISDANGPHHKFFRMNEQLYMIEPGETDYSIYHYDQELILYEILPNDANTGYLIISDMLFILENNMLKSYENPLIFFPYEEGKPIYNHELSLMLYVVQEYKTTYRLMNSSGIVGEYEIKKKIGDQGITYNNDFALVKLYVRGQYEMLFINDDFGISGLVNVPSIMTFWASNVTRNSYIINVKETIEGIELLQAGFGDGVNYYRRYVITEAPVAIILPFYSNFSVWAFLPILIALFIPLTNYRKSILVIDFQYAMLKMSPRI